MNINRYCGVPFYHVAPYRRELGLEYYPGSDLFEESNLDQDIRDIIDDFLVFHERNILSELPDEMDYCEHFCP